MGMGHGLGPVFTCESVLSARRWQVYAGRSGFALILLVGMICIWLANVPGAIFTPFTGVAASPRIAADVGTGFFYMLTGTQLSLILLAAPAAAAGSLGMDRARGTLLQLMVTDLSDVEIVLGTLAARLAPVVSLIVCSAPVTALAALLGGIEFSALAGAFVVTLALALLGCVLALALSIWATKTHEVLTAVYLAEGLWLVAAELWSGLSGPASPGPPAWFWKANPYMLVFAPYWQPGYVQFADIAVFVGGVLAVSVMLSGLSVVMLRRVVVGQASAPMKAAERRSERILQALLPSWPSPSLERHPVLWREWHRSRPSRLARVLESCVLAITWTLAAWGTYEIMTVGVSEDAETLEVSLSFSLVFGLLMLSAAAPTALAEERARGSLDVLMATPLATREIVMAKWLGMVRRVLLMLPLFVYGATFLAITAPDVPVRPAGAGMNLLRVAPIKVGDRIMAAVYCPVDFLASGALLVSIGLALSIWVRRLGRAVALSVIVFFAIGIAWVPLVDLAVPYLVKPVLNNYVKPLTSLEQNHLIQYLEALSPAFGPTLPLNTFRWYRESTVWYWLGLGVVIATKVLAAAILCQLSVLTFDRCLGRVPERGARRHGPMAAVVRAKSARRGGVWETLAPSD